MLSIYVLTCDSMLVAVAVFALEGARLMVPELFALPKETPRCLFPCWRDLLRHER